MKIIENKYVIESTKTKKKYKILSISDIHNNEKVLDKLTASIKEIQPDYICIPGDLFDKINENIDKLIKWIKTISSFTNKIIISLGNHDQINFIKGKWFLADNSIYLSRLRMIPKCIVLSNLFDMYKENDIIFSAINMSSIWYHDDKEKKEGYLKTVNSIPVNSFDGDKFNILLQHSPKWLVKNNELIANKSYEQLNKVDLFLSGHYHGGMMPNFLQFMPYHIGIIGPRKHIPLLYAYGKWSNKKATLILSTGVTKLSKTSGILHHLNFLFSPCIETIEIIPKKR